MRTYFFWTVFATCGFLFSCTNCDNKNKQDEDTNRIDSTSINKSDTLDSSNNKDSLTVEDSAAVNIYEVVEESNSESNDEKSPTVNVSRRGETQTQKIVFKNKTNSKFPKIGFSYKIIN